MLVSFQNVVKKYGLHYALNDVSFSVKKKSITSFVGPNGAGKTTSILILLNLLFPDSGKIERHYLFRKGKIAFNLDIPLGFSRLSISQNICLFSDLYEIKDNETWIETIIEMLNLGHIVHKPYYTLSGGMRKRVDLALAFISRPEFVILDEPTTNLDITNIDLLIKMLTFMNNEHDVTFFISSHNLKFVSEIASHFIFIDKGEIKYNDENDHLSKLFNGKMIVVKRISQKIENLCRKNECYIENISAEKFKIYCWKVDSYKELINNILQDCIIGEYELSLYDIYKYFIIGK